MRQQQAAAATRSTYRLWPKFLKPDVPKYKVVEDDSLLKCFVEIDDAIEDPRINDNTMMFNFAMSSLTGRAKAWILECNVQDSYIFTTYEVFMARLIQMLESPRAKSRAHAGLLDLKHGKHDIHAHAQYARCLVSCIALTR